MDNKTIKKIESNLAEAKCLLYGAAIRYEKTSDAGRANSLTRLANSIDDWKAIFMN